jgi:hypothetical protein
MYDKGERILRVETTINNPWDIRVFRPKEGGAPDDLSHRRMRKGIADLERRSQVSQHANERYLEALSEFDTDTPLAQLLGPLTKPVTKRGRRVRGLRPWNPQDLELFKAINRPEHLISGFQNKDLATALFPKQQNHPKNKRSASAKTSYRLRILHTHGLIAKIPNTRRYKITTKGRKVCTAILLAQHATVQQLNPKAA